MAASAVGVSLGAYNVSIKEGKHCHTATGEYVELEHGQQYTVSVNNNGAMRCELDLAIDGKDMGTCLGRA